jgi:hypothetical protein
MRDEEPQMETHWQVNREVRRMIPISLIESSKDTRFPFDHFQDERCTSDLAGHIG